MRCRRMRSASWETYSSSIILVLFSKLFSRGNFNVWLSLESLKIDTKALRMSRERSNILESSLNCYSFTTVALLLLLLHYYSLLPSSSKSSAISSATSPTRPRSTYCGERIFARSNLSFQCFKSARSLNCSTNFADMNLPPR